MRSRCRGAIRIGLTGLPDTQRKVEYGRRASCRTTETEGGEAFQKGDGVLKRKILTKRHQVLFAIKTGDGPGGIDQKRGVEEHPLSTDGLPIHGANENGRASRRQTSDKSLYIRIKSQQRRNRGFRPDNQVGAPHGNEFRLSAQRIVYFLIILCRPLHLLRNTGLNSPHDDPACHHRVTRHLAGTSYANHPAATENQQAHHHFQMNPSTSLATPNLRRKPHDRQGKGHVDQNHNEGNKGNPSPLRKLNQCRVIILADPQRIPREAGEEMGAHEFRPDPNHGNGHQQNHTVPQRERGARARQPPDAARHDETEPSHEERAVHREGDPPQCNEYRGSKCVRDVKQPGEGDEPEDDAGDECTDKPRLGPAGQQYDRQRNESQPRDR